MLLLPFTMHLLSIDPLLPRDIIDLLDAADAWLERFRSPSPPARLLEGRIVVNAFFEASTRTRASFEIAAKRLSAMVVNLGASGSSVSKGETLLDTAKNLEKMHMDALVLRHPSSGAAEFLSKHLQCTIINAGDGTHEHPTQALLDALTLRRHKGSLEGKKVAVIGDIERSRVARSNALVLGKLGAEVWLFGPETMMPRHAEALGPTVRVGKSLEQTLEGADAVMMLRIQAERFDAVPLHAGASPLSSRKDYARAFGLHESRLALAKSDVIVMHPGPICRGVELGSAVADGEESVILDQVEAGVAVRAAVFEWLLSARQEA